MFWLDLHQRSEEQEEAAPDRAYEACQHVERGEVVVPASFRAEADQCEACVRSFVL